MSDKIEKKYSLDLSPVKRISVTYPVLKNKFKQVMSPDVEAGSNQLIRTEYGSKLSDVSLASVWRYFFEKRILDFDKDVYVYFKKGSKGLEDTFALDDVAEKPVFEKMMYQSEQYFEKVFRENVEDSVLMHGGLKKKTKQLTGKQLESSLRHMNPRMSSFRRPMLGLRSIYSRSQEDNFRFRVRKMRFSERILDHFSSRPA